MSASLAFIKGPRQIALTRTGGIGGAQRLLAEHVADQH